jgi:asparagine synthase (glutamine-hydrolysing)
MDIRLQHNRGKSWTGHRLGSLDARVKGSAFFDGEFFQGPGFAALLARLFAKGDGPGFRGAVSEVLRRFNGQFAFVVAGPDTAVAGVDRLRSIPLFYGQRHGALTIGDSPEWVGDPSADAEISDWPRREFLLTGFVTGPETLSRSVKQLQAGEWISWRKSAHRWGDPQVNSYYRFCCPDRIVHDFREKEREFDSLSIEVFERVVRALSGRTVVLPLSGGYDSRFIAVMLKRMGYDNVICFSYGAPGNGESAVSETVARRLGYRWHFIPYTRRLWREYFHSGHRGKFFTYASALSSLPCIQDWPAVGELKRRDLVPPDSVFAPGNKGFIYWNPMRDAIESCPYPGPDAMVRIILDAYYNLWGWSRREDTLLAGFSSRINRHLDFPGPIRSTADMIAASELWEFQERQAKFIINSMRCYEYWGYDWALPICDAEMVDFWLHVDKKSWYLEFLRRWRHFGLTHSPPSSRAVRILKSGAKRFISAWKPLYYLKMGFRTRRSRYLDYFRHIHRWYGFHTPRQHITATSSFPSFRWSHTSNVNSVLTRMVIEESDGAETGHAHGVVG